MLFEIVISGKRKIFDGFITEPDCYTGALRGFNKRFRVSGEGLILRVILRFINPKFCALLCERPERR